MAQAGGQMPIAFMPDLRKRPVTTIMLPKERAWQLRALAAAQQLGVTELIECVIEDGILQALIPDETPGFSLQYIGHLPDPRWTFWSEAFSLSRLDLEGVRMLADAFAAVA